MTLKIEKIDRQYLLILFTIVCTFLCTDIFRVLDKFELSYFSGRLFSQPYRGLTSHFAHYDLNHLLSNVFGIVVARYFLKELKLTSTRFFLVLVSFLIPLQSCLQLLVDIYLLKRQMYILVGFSGILYGINSFILLSSIYGKRKFFNLQIDLVRNPKVCNAILFLTGIGLCFSLFPKISFSAHFTGLIAGGILFLA